MPGMPAWRAGIEPGDEIVEIGKLKEPSFTQLMTKVTLGDKQEGIVCQVRRAASGEIEAVPLKPEQNRGHGLAKIGILSPATMTLIAEEPARLDSPAARAEFVEMRGQAVNIEAAAGEVAFAGGGVITRVNDVPIKSHRDWLAELAKQPDKPVRVTVERKLVKLAPDAAQKGDQSPTPDSQTDSVAEAAGANDAHKAPGETIVTVFDVPTQRVRRFGLVMDMGPVTAIQEGSPAQEAGLKEDDLIVSVDDQQLSDGSAASTGWDPLTLPDYLRRAASEGRTIQLSVRTLGPDGQPTNNPPRTIELKPQVPTTFYDALQPNSPLGVAAAGFAYQVENTVHAVVANSSAASAGVAAGDKIDLAKLVLPDSAKDKFSAGEPLQFGDSYFNMPCLFTAIQSAPEGTAVEFTFTRGTGGKQAEQLKKKIEPVFVDGLFVADRGFNFEPITRIRKANSLGEQIRYGFDETAESLLMVYRFLQKTWEGQVPLSAFGGPITIARAAGSEASKGISSLLIFLTMLSANLAVINFLPIPILDGGHIVFLAYEGIRGRPANERFVVAMHVLGFALIVTLMLFVFGLDLGLIPRNL